ncbi:MAG: hypothetical protein IJV80_01825, partial [Clostridia bacterium]|nr:hypothetical protein [Clostridia bacterium]
MAITFLFCFLFARFFYVQIVWSETLNYRALDQWMREIPIVAERGKIVDSSGVVLADNTTAYTVYLRSNAVKNKAETAKVVANALGISEAELLEKLNKVKASEITVKKHATKAEIEALCKKSVEGLYYSRDNVRYYPKGQ